MYYDTEEKKCIKNSCIPGATFNDEEKKCECPPEKPYSNKI